MSYQHMVKYHGEAEMTSRGGAGGMKMALIRMSASRVRALERKEILMGGAASIRSLWRE